MVRVINIDTKARTIRVSNEDKDIDWITVKGTHVPIKKGESKGEAVEKFVESKRGGQSDWEKQFGPLDKPLSKSAIKRMQKEDFDKNVRDAARRNAEEKARKSREKALKDQEEADFQKWKKEQQKPAKKETPDTSNADYFKSTMQETMKKFPRLYEHEQKHLEEYAVSAFSALRNNPGKEKAIVDAILDSYNQHVKRLGMWVDTPTLAKKAFVEKLAEAYK